LTLEPINEELPISDWTSDTCTCLDETYARTASVETAPQQSGSTRLSRESSPVDYDRKNNLFLQSPQVMPAPSILVSRDNRASEQDSDDDVDLNNGSNPGNDLSSLGSEFSGSSLALDEEAIRRDSADILLCNINDTNLVKASPSKTWIDLGRAFINAKKPENFKEYMRQMRTVGHTDVNDIADLDTVLKETDGIVSALCNDIDTGKDILQNGNAPDITQAGSLCRSRNVSLVTESSKETDLEISSSTSAIQPSTVPHISLAENDSELREKYDKINCRANIPYICAENESKASRSPPLRTDGGESSALFRVAPTTLDAVQQFDEMMAIPKFAADEVFDILDDGSNMTEIGELNVLSDGSCQSSKRENKKVGALINIFQALGIMPQSLTPSLHGASPTTPASLDSLTLSADKAVNQSPKRRVLTPYTHFLRPSSQLSAADTDASSSFGEKLERFWPNERDVGRDGDEGNEEDVRDSSIYR